MVARRSRHALAGLALAFALGVGGEARAQTPVIPDTQGVGHIRSMTHNPLESAAHERLRRLAEQVRRHPDDAELLATYGLALVRSGQHDEGLNALMRASAREPEEPRVSLLYSKALIKTGHPEQAIEQALKAARSPLSSEDEVGEAFSVAGFARYRQGRVPEAEKYLRQSVKHTPRNAGAVLNLGLVLYSSGRRAAGVAAMEKAAQLAPEDPRIQRIVADLYDNTGQPRKSLEAWEKVSSAHPEDVDVHLKIAMGWVSLGEAGKAVTHLRDAVAAQPNNHRVHVVLAAALAQIGSFEEARTEAARARDLGAEVTELLKTIEGREQVARDDRE